MFDTWLACPGFLAFSGALNHVSILLSALSMLVMMLAMRIVRLNLSMMMLIMLIMKLLIASRPNT